MLRKGTSPHRLRTFFLGSLAALVLALLVGYPLLTVLLSQHWVKVFWDPEIIAVAAATAKQACLSTAFSLVLGTAMGFALVAEPRLSRLLLIPYSLPTLLVAMSLVPWITKLGFGFSLGAVIFAHVVLNAPWIAVQVAECLRRFSPAWEEAARTLGATPHKVRIFLKLRWVAGTLRQSGAHVFSLCVTSFTIVLLLGGGPPVDSLETLLYSKVRLGSVDLAQASAVAVWEILLCLVPYLLLFGRKEISYLSSRTQIQAQKSWGVSPRRFWLLGGLLVLPWLIPYAGLFLPARWMPLLTHDLWSEVRSPLWVSLKIAFFSASGSLAFALLFLVARWALKPFPWLAQCLEASVQFVGGISILVLALGFWLAYAEWVDPFEGSLLAMVCIQSVVFFPLCYRSLRPLLEQRPIRLLEAARTLGATGPRAFWQVELPHWSPGVFSAFRLVLCCSLGEVAAVSFFYSEKLVPLPLVISRAMGQYQFEKAAALSSLIAGMVVVVLGSSFKWRRRT